MRRKPIVPSQDEISEAISDKVSKWLLKECLDIFGEEELRGITDIHSFLRSRGYDLYHQQNGMVISFELMEGEKRKSYLNVNVMSLTMELAKKKNS